MQTIEQQWGTSLQTRTKKLFQISGRVALTTAGLVGHAQSLARMLSAELSLYELEEKHPHDSERSRYVNCEYPRW